MNDVLFWLGYTGIVVGIYGIGFCSGVILSESLHIWWKVGYRERVKSQVLRK